MKKIICSLLALAGFGCVSFKENYQGGNLSADFYFTREVTAENYNQIPAEARKFTIGKDFIELDIIDGKHTGKLTKSLVYNEFTLAEKRKLSFIIGADWQFKAFLNGSQIFDSSKYGNKPLYHSFQVDCEGRAGKNLLTIEVTRGKATSLFFCGEGVKQSYDFSKPVTIKLFPEHIVGTVKPMNAVNNGPKPAGSTQTKSNMEAWKRAKIPYARNHDASISGYGSAHIVDINMIFPDFSKDPYDPASYDFTLSDIYHKNILDGGTAIFYRLGSRIEHSIVKYGTKKPADFKKWAVICEHIIRHYTEGWANGFKWDVKYWEIWNEPDLSSGEENKRTWGGTDEEFFEMYRIAAIHLKEKFPHLKIGGPALAGNIDWMKLFLKAMTTGERVPIDFFSWHVYASNPDAAVKRARVVRSILDSYGYKTCESILNEWNYVRNWTNSFVYSIETIIGIKGAAFAAAVMNCSQNAPVDMLMYYDARPGTGFNGLFDFYTMRPLKTYYVFCLWSKLAELGRQFKIEYPENPEISAVGAVGADGKTGILISRYTDEDKLPPAVTVKLQSREFSSRCVKLYLLDKNNDLVEKTLKFNSKGLAVFDMEANTVVYIESAK